MRTRVLLIGGTGNNLFQISYALKKVTDNQELIFLKPTPIFGTLQKRLLRADARAPNTALQYLRGRGFSIEEISLRDLLFLGVAFIFRKLRQAFGRVLSLRSDRNDCFIVTRTFLAGYFQDHNSVDLNQLTSLARDMISFFRDSCCAEGIIPPTGEGLLVVHYRAGDNKQSSWETTFQAILSIIASDIKTLIREVVIVGPHLNEPREEQNWSSLGDKVCVGFRDQSTEVEDLILFSTAQFLLVDISTFSYMGALANARGRVFIPCEESKYPFQAQESWRAV